MRKSYPASVLMAAIAMAWIGLSIWAVYIFRTDSEIDLHTEEGVLEIAQEIVLVLACIAYLATAVFKKNIARLLPLFCALLCYAFLIRELEIEHTDITPAIKFFAHGAGRDITITAAFVAMLSYAVMYFSYYRSAALEFVKSKAGLLLMTGGALLMVGRFFDKHTPETIRYLFYEEMVELPGYIAILLSSVIAGRYRKKLPAESQPTQES